MNGACNSTFLAPGEGSNRQISLNFNNKSISKIFISNFVCILTNSSYIYHTGFLFFRLGHAPGTWGCWGQKFNFTEYGDVEYQFFIKLMGMIRRTEYK